MDGQEDERNEQDETRECEAAASQPPPRFVDYGLDI